jgi:carboxypeptidase Q
MNQRLVFALMIFIISSFELYSIELTETHFLNRYSEIADRIISSARQDSDAYKRLEYMCDVFGPRLSGSENLEKTLEWMLDEMKKDGFQNVRADEVLVPHWVRRYEKCEMLYPRIADVPVFALGGSIGTPKDGIKAKVMVVKSFDELELRKDEVKGKIVVYNFNYEGYGKGVQYRFHGAVPAAKYGAVASLIRSVSPNVSRNLHTGMMKYEDSITAIPHAAISPEDAMLFERLISYGKTPEINLILDVETLPDAKSFNVMGEIVGSELPNEIIALGGHSDSWDAGTGAHDNASGCVVTWEAIKLLKKLGLKPKRTIRIVQWTNEENGVRGGNAYRDAHQNEKHVLMFEHDSGIFPPNGIRFNGNDTILSILKETTELFNKISKSTVTKGGGGVDITPMVKTGVPAMSIGTDDGSKYFYYHHNHSDTVDKIKKEDFNNCLATIALAIYLYSDLPNDIFNN